MELSKNAQQVLRNKYTIGKESTFEEVCKRVAHAIASVEENGKREYWEEKFYDTLINLKALPGGRILKNAGGKTRACHNCHSIPLKDDIYDIGEFYKKALVLNAQGGGIGTFVDLRPESAPIKTKGGNSTGPISFLEVLSKMLSVIGTDGGGTKDNKIIRRSGALTIMDVSHPDIFKYIRMKRDTNYLTNFNVSVGVTNEFLDAVETNSDWILEYNGIKYKTIKAKELFDEIIENMLQSGEPGIINLDNMYDDNLFYYEKVNSVNLCSELKLISNSSCCLGSIVLPNFITPKGYTKWDDLKETIHIMVRFLDNVLDYNNYAFEDMKKATLSARRLGLGVIGLGDYLIEKNVRYGSPEAIGKTEGLIKFLRNEAYSASVELAKEKGTFPVYNNWAYPQSRFIKTLPAKLRMAIKKHGIRNCSLMAFAPGGSLSLIADVSSGIEPIYAKGYKRIDQAGERYYIHPKVKEAILNNNENDLPDYIVDAHDITPSEHLDMLVAIQKYNCGSCSKTINAPNDYTSSELNDLILEYARDVVGITFYRDGSRPGQILQRLSDEEIVKIVKEENKVEEEEGPHEETVRCAMDGVCEL